MKRDDTLWKSILEDIFDDFLLFFDPQADAIFDFSKDFEYLDKELEQLFPPEDNLYQTRFVDKLVKVHCKNGDNEWILVHIEVQGYHDPHFSQRMFTYYSRILDKYNKPVTAFAIFTDGNEAFRPCEYYREFMGTSILYRYNAFKILDQDDEMLRDSNNPFAIVILTVKTALKRKSLNEDELLDLKIELTKSLLEKNFLKHKIRKLMAFLRYYVRFEKYETVAKFDQVLDALTKRTKNMGIEEFLLDRAKKEGQYEKSLEIIRKLLKDKVYSIEEIARVVGEPIDLINKIRLGNQ
ncbi:hypothetical protein LZD49_11780 [Dyadobacter sp. CY261]|uniref:hypothetical protein n=1 Tax=Dyadobacter sp. CY261 TaxID=2907203 RepID=UPI001F3D5CC3|nr:hypothetical protein [Dyadobacter sp. CY261]MCF0071151.1 hypothetical protein [Dyadobacter sp. CY261]